MDREVPWLSIFDPARYARIGKTRLYQLINLGELRPRKLGRRTLLARAEIDALIEAGSAPTTKASKP